MPATRNGIADGSLKALARDGYIFVVQNLRGRFGSEGTFELSSKADLENPKATSETTDAYDSIDWLVKNVANNNGKVGMFGVSYDGLTSAMTLLRPHPALKAISEQASPADQWMNDDTHRYGALRESYAFEYAVYEQADKHANTHFDFDRYDTYSWYLALGPLSNINASYLHGTIPFWNSIVEHPDYDAFWKDEAWVTQVKGAFVPNLNVAGFWDQEDPWGPWEIYRRSELSDPNRYNFIVAGPWFHGQWHNPSAESIGQVPFGGHDTAVEFRERSRRHGSATGCTARARNFRGRRRRSRPARTAGRPTPPGRRRRPRPASTCAATARSRSRRRRPRTATCSTSRIRPTRCRTGRVRSPRPIRPATGGDGKSRISASWSNRPDVATWVSAPLDRDLVVTGELSADLFASTSGTDSDFVVKLIDVYPERAQPNAWNAEAGPQPGQFAQSLNGYQLPIAMEVRRGRYNTSYEHPQPLVANQPAEFVIPLRSHDHVFLKGHRLMVQVQSTWFPLIDRNPQTFVPSIYAARAEDFVAATQRVYTSRERASHIVLPVIR